jgi:uncharacterized phage protein (TIGR02218 family)
MEVKRSAVGTIELHHPMPFPIAEGDAYSMHAGCQKRFSEDCVTRFANGINFRGFPHLPGNAIHKVGGINRGYEVG